MNNKIKTLNSLVKIVEKLKKQKKTVVFANGCYDILHIGHIRLLKKAKSLGDIVVLAINSDSSIKRLKGPARPVVSEKQRAEIASAIEYVDYLLIFREDTPERVINKIRPDVLVKGADWKLNDIVGRDVAKKVVRFPIVKGFSVTNLINKIKASC